MPSVALSALGVSVIVEYPDEPEAESFFESLAPLQTAAADTDAPTWRIAHDADGWWLLHGLNAPGRSTTMIGLLGPLLQWLNTHISEHSDPVAVHAAAIVIDDAGVLVAGHSGAGKSTLAAALVEAGATYLGDEAIGISREGLLIAYPKPLTLEAPARGLLPALSAAAVPSVEPADTADWHVAVHHIRPGAVGVGGTLRHIVLTQYVPGAPTTLQPMSRATTLAELSDLTFRFGERSRLAFDTLASVVRRAECHRMTSGDLGSAARAVAGLCSQRGQSAERRR